MVRLTINLNEDHYAAVKFLARERDGSISDVVNSLLSRALGPLPNLDAKKGRKGSSTGLPVVACDHAITSEDVHRLESDDI